METEVMEMSSFSTQAGAGNTDLEITSSPNNETQNTELEMSSISNKSGNIGVVGVGTPSLNNQAQQVPFDDMYKILLVGAPNAGKSALVQRFCSNDFVEEHNSTLVEYGFFAIGIDLKVRDLELRGQLIKLKLWDTSGEERYRSVINAYCRGSAAGVMVVYDVSDLKSFTDAKKWITVLSDFATSNTSKGWNPVKILVGNKNDLLVKRVVSKINGEQLAIENKYLFIETSAKTGLNVLECFQSISLAIKHSKDKITEDRKAQSFYRQYPESRARYENMNKVIKQLELEQRRHLNSNSATDGECSVVVEDSECGCISRNRICRIL